MQRFFVSDVHLNENEPAITAGFLHFISSIPSNSELYILGDLFDFWIGDDIETELSSAVAIKFKEISNRNIKIYFISGNRDFLLGKRFAKRCNMEILPNIHELIFNTKSDEISLLLMHGDELCLDDIEYQSYRKKVHNQWIQRLFLLLPKVIRKKIATALRKKSTASNKQKSNNIMDVNQLEVERYLTHYHAEIMIHGHTHRLNSHQFILNGQSKTRFVLGAWHDSFNYLCLSDDGQLTAHYL